MITRTSAWVNIAQKSIRTLSFTTTSRDWSPRRDRATLVFMEQGAYPLLLYRNCSGLIMPPVSYPQIWRLLTFIAQPRQLTCSTVSAAGPLAFRASYPCCSVCTLQAGTVQFYYWNDLATPTATVTPAPTHVPANATASLNGTWSTLSTYVDDSGFTFTYPSVYIAFTSIGARDMCGKVGTEYVLSFSLPSPSSRIRCKIHRYCLLTMRTQQHWYHYDCI
jgi:hypothetical protein